MNALNEVWAGVSSGFGQDLSPDLECVLKRMFFTGASAALALHGMIELIRLQLLRLETMQSFWSTPTQLLKPLNWPMPKGARRSTAPKQLWTL